MYKLELYEKELQATSKGREILNIIIQYAEEVTALINQNREVMVVWQRNKGPLFFTDIMGSGFNQDIIVKKEIQGKSLVSLIRRMAVVLQDYGSSGLKRAIDTHYLLVLEYAQSCDSLGQIFLKLRSDG